jgi:hypothetical protein
MGRRALPETKYTVASIASQGTLIIWNSPPTCQDQYVRAGCEFGGLRGFRAVRYVSYYLAAAVEGKGLSGIEQEANYRRGLGDGCVGNDKITNC